MKISTLFTTTFLVWIAYDANLFRRRGDSYSSSVAITLEIKKEQKRFRRLTGPPWREKIPPKLRMKVNHFSSRSKDPRYSDQQKIRRRINNM